MAPWPPENTQCMHGETLVMLHLAETAQSA